MTGAPAVRIAAVTDLAAIDAIYNHYVLTSTCTYQCEPTRPEERLEWFRARGPEHPVTVAVDGGDVVGWGALSLFRARAAYRFTVENAVYVRSDLHRRGIGARLLADLVERATRLGHRAVIAGISAEQTASVALHRRQGFVEAGLVRQVGFKFDQWLDLLLMQRLLP